MQQILRLADISDTMNCTLASPVKDVHGNVLVNVGTILTATLRASLERRDVTEVCVEVPDTMDADSVFDAEQFRARLDRLFRKCGTSVASAELQQLVHSYRVRKSECKF
jgi:hypothetical protein